MSSQFQSAIAHYQSSLAQLKSKGHKGEGQTRRAFGRLLETLSHERGYLFVEEYPVGKQGRKKIDGAVRDDYASLGYWEAKDEGDTLPDEIQKKIAIGYPVTNTIFEDTNRAILWQNKKQIGEFDLTRGDEIGDLLDRFFGYTEADREGFGEAVRDFKSPNPTAGRQCLSSVCR